MAKAKRNPKAHSARQDNRWLVKLHATEEDKLAIRKAAAQDRRSIGDWLLVLARQHSK